MYTLEQVKKGVAAYLDQEFMPMLDDNTFKKVIAGAAISLAIERYSNLVPLLVENQFVKSLQVTDDAGNIDVDTLAKAVNANMPDKGVPVNIPTLGTMTFHKEDIDKLVSYISKQR